MGFLRTLGKISGIEEIVKWSRGKAIEVHEKNVYGQHFVYVDNDYNICIVLAKADGTLHIFIGDIVEAKRHIKYGADNNKMLDRVMESDEMQWKINPNRVLYHGLSMPNKLKVYKGKVISSNAFNKSIDDNWINLTKDVFLKEMQSSGNLKSAGFDESLL